MNDGYTISSDPLLQGGAWSKNGNKLVAPTLYMSVFKSADGGNSWQRKALSSEPGEIRTICSNPFNKNVLYAGGFINKLNADLVPVKYSRMYTSTDGGDSWKETGNNSFGKIEDEIITKIITSPSQKNIIYVCTSNGVYISADGGNNWSAPKQKINFNSILCDPADNNTFYGCGKDGFWISRDAGISWQEMNDGLPVKELLCFDYDSLNKIIYTGSRGAGMFRLALAK